MVLIGYFGVMIIFMSAAIATAKSKFGWIWYFVGAGIQLISMMGNQKAANANGGNITVYWIVYAVILVVAAAIILLRYNRHNRKTRDS